MKSGFYASSSPNPSLSLALRRVSCLKLNGEIFMQNDSEWREMVVALRSIDGSGIVSMEQNCYEMPSDSLLLLHRSNTQSLCLKGEGWQLLCFEFLCGNTGHLPFDTVLPCEKRHNEETLCQECASLLVSGDTGARSAASAILAMLLHLWLQCIQIGGHNMMHWERVERMKAYMLEHLNENLSVASLARIADLSERRFRDVFHQQTGMSPKQYLNNLRIVYSEKYLLEMPYSIKEIAQRLGYTNQFHFNRAFREVHGMSPSTFRAQKK